MATVLESLKGINAYPIPLRTILDVGVGRKLPLDSDVDETILTSKAYQLATADLYYWLAVAPDVSQGGQSYGFTDEHRVQFRNRANALYGECGEGGQTKSIYGYKGPKL